MIKLENVVLPSPKQWEAIIRGARNPMNSWDKSDSYITHIENPETLNTADFEFHMGEADKDLLMRLAKAGSDHAKYKRMIVVYVDITAPLYWWKEFDTYKVGTVANSCSTMHKIHAKEFTLEDFSCEHLMAFRDQSIPYASNETAIYDFKATLGCLIETLNAARRLFLETNDKKYWWQMIQLLPSSYNQRRTIEFNYENLANMYRSRKNHKLQEWRDLCEWIKTLPHSELITLEDAE